MWAARRRMTRLTDRIPAAATKVTVGYRR